MILDRILHDVVVALIGAAFLLALVLAGRAIAEPAPALGGTYRCEPDPRPCDWSGTTFTVVQSGQALEIKNDKGDVGRGSAESSIGLTAGAPWNMLGIVLPGGNALQWSNGTIWRKQ
jgi:hypothetical protein